VKQINEGISYLDGVFDNPPLFVFTLTLISKIVGISEIFFRIFIVFCALITTLLVYRVCLILGDKKKAIFASGFYAFFPMNVIFSKIVQIDMYGIALMMLAFYFSILGIKKNKIWFYPSGFFLGLTIISKIPFGLSMIPIIYYMKKKNIESKYIISFILTAFIIPIIWITYILLTNFNYLKRGAGSSSNFFGLGPMHSAAPLYQLYMILIALFLIFFLTILIIKKRPINFEEKTLIIFIATFSFFFIILPNHEYYLLTVFAPLFIFLSLKINSTKKNKILLTVFLFISISILILRPVYEVNWKEPCFFVKENYSNDIIIFSSNPKVSEYYLNRDVKWLHPDQINYSSAYNTIFMFTTYDKMNLRNIGLLNMIEENFVLLKDYDNKIFLYGSENLKRGVKH
jgi:4-amino-4-deoxy-L-arabinose transferase-like glycosyltransferase